MRYLVIAAGDTHTPETGAHLLARSAWDLLLGADGGAARALDLGLVPDLVIGDMDSLSAEIRTALEARACRFVVHPRAKDETDLELALTYAVQQGATEIVVLGALGGRLDHTLANLLLLALPALEGISVRIVEGEQQARLVRSGEALTLRGQPGDLVSLLPLGGDCLGVSATGLAWPLDDDNLQLGYSRGVSNAMAGTEASLYLQQGLLLVVQGPGEPGAAIDRAHD